MTMHEINLLFELINNNIINKSCDEERTKEYKEAIRKILNEYLTNCSRENNKFFICKDADNSCRQEKLGCKGCYHNINNTNFGKYATLEIKLKEFSEIIKNTFKKDYMEINIVVDRKYIEDINKPIEFFIELKNAYGVTQINFVEKVSDFMKNYSFIISDIISHINKGIVRRSIERGF